MENLDIKSLRAEFDADPELEDQFGSFENFLSYRKAGATGQFIHDPAGYLSFSVLTKGNVTVETPGAKFEEATATNDELKEHFSQTQLVQDEFGDTESYLAYVHGERRRAAKDERLCRRHERKRQFVPSY